MNLDIFTPADNEKLLKDFGQRRDINYLHYNVTLLSTMPVTQLPTQHSHLEVSQTGKLNQFYILPALLLQSSPFQEKTLPFLYVLKPQHPCSNYPSIFNLPPPFCLYCQQKKISNKNTSLHLLCLHFQPKSPIFCTWILAIDSSLLLILVYSSPSFTLVFPIHSSHYSKNNTSKTKVSSCMLQ